MRRPVYPEAVHNEQAAVSTEKFQEKYSVSTMSAQSSEVLYSDSFFFFFVNRQWPEEGVPSFSSL